ncbi:MAG: nucleotide sugar dehydrogenase [Armatimonadota bacterium]|nr:nucleotide sugar dehydrogenase [Armatimonadota bacterium]MDR7452258.1 nucleotide sugar dehydrogenase [Armatimonadota bacterium]MDR7467978.1 nucleotide sugar dehydrogenase [Armatimonadota bacterium]MDR7494820.1 nucleotide sugar dehydrogenase [Armatimonadota bacterium]MDR7499226.1 nucleotide sugar dehydrogenase [Armatimonadota bacterium]
MVLDTGVVHPEVASGAQNAFDRAVLAREARIAVIGVGYVGLPLALAYAAEGFRVVGLDIDAGKTAMLNAGHSYVDDVPSSVLALQVEAGRFRATEDPAALESADAIFICVPTPCTRNKEPDTSQIRSAAECIAGRLRPGAVVILRSTSYPGTTEELVRPILESGGHRVGADVFLAFAPERVDPGRKDFTIRNTPVVVGGCDPESTRRAALVLGQVADHIVPVSSPAAAEMAKLLENVFRNVNIALVNQLAMLCDRMGLDIWEITRAAATKPYGFLPFQPGPGVGGHCIPVDPYYLAWKAREYDFHMDFIELAARVNDEMPYYVATKILLALNGHQVGGAPKVLVVGVTFKRDIADFRHSPAIKLMEILRRRGAIVTYHDPFVPALTLDGETLESAPLTEDTLAAADCVVIATDHTRLDYGRIVRKARLVFDTRNATARVTEGREKILRI